MSIVETGSKTAVMAAAYRARASRRPHPVCVDPWAQLLAGDEGQALIQPVDELLPEVELGVAVRTAYFDAQVRRWTAPPASLRQVVILGAGFDTRAARLARVGVRYFEVDHPSTQAEKRRRLGVLTGYPEGCAISVPCDFDHDDFIVELRRHGFDAAQPALVVWEGVIPYLSEPVIRATFRKLATELHEGSVVVFDYLQETPAKSPAKAMDDAHKVADDAGEQFRFLLNDALPLLYEEGFRHVRDVSVHEACLTLTGSYDGGRHFFDPWQLTIASRSAIAAE